MKLGQLVNDGFVNSLNELNKKELPMAIAYRVSKITSKMAEEQKEYFRLRGDLIKKFVQKNEDGSNKTIDRGGRKVMDFGDNETKVVEELNALEEQDVEVPKIKLSDLLAANIKMTPGQINDIAGVLEE